MYMGWNDLLHGLCVLTLYKDVLICNNIASKQWNTLTHISVSTRTKPSICSHEMLVFYILFLFYCRSIRLFVFYFMNRQIKLHLIHNPSHPSLEHCMRKRMSCAQSTCSRLTHYLAGCNRIFLCLLCLHWHSKLWRNRTIPERDACFMANYSAQNERRNFEWKWDEMYGADECVKYSRMQTVLKHKQWKRKWKWK